MSAYPDLRVISNSLERTDGAVWYRLHSEREDICEALNEESRAGHEDRAGGLGLSKEDTGRPDNRHWELLQSRLRKIDDALDRLLAGSYGHCSKCGRWIEDSKLDLDPAIAFCVGCGDRNETITNLPTMPANTERIDRHGKNESYSFSRQR